MEYHRDLSWAQRFDIFINNLDEGIDGMLIKYADGTKLGRVVKNIENRNRIQYDLDGIRNWAQTNKVNFILDKCKAVYLGRKN